MKPHPIALRIAAALAVALGSAACQRKQDGGPPPVAPPPPAQDTAVVPRPADLAPAPDGAAPPTQPAADAAGPAIAADAAGGELFPESLVAQRVHEFTADNWYGLYLQDKKVGWANLVLRRSREGEPGALAISLEVTAEFVGFGPAKRMTMFRQLFYGGDPPYPLLEARIRDESPDGRMEQTLVARPDRIVLTTVTDGGAPVERTFPPTRETAVAAFAELALEPAYARPGLSLVTESFDVDKGRDHKATVTVVSVEDEVISGIPTRVATLSHLEEEDNNPTTTRVAAGGVTLEVSIGVGLVLRLEEQEFAQSGIEAFNVVTEQIAVNRPLGDPTTLRELTLIVGAAPGLTIPGLPSQTVTPRPDGRFDVVVRSAPGAEVTAQERADSLRATHEYDADDPAVAALAAQVTAGAASAEEKVARLVDWVYENLDKALATNLTAASQVLERKAGDCTEHALLFVALARAAGLPARGVSGVMYMGDVLRGFGWHRWAQVELDGRWVAVDPAWGEHVADAARLALDFGDSNDSVALIGSLTIEAPEAGPSR